MMAIDHKQFSSCVIPFAGANSGLVLEAIRRLEQCSDTDMEAVYEFRRKYQLAVDNVRQKAIESDLADASTVPVKYDLGNMATPVINLLN